MTWEIKIPGDPAERLDARTIWELPNALDSHEEKMVCRELLAACRTAGMRRVGEVTLGLEQLTVDERRSLLDGLRRRCGLKSATQIDDERRYERANEASAARAAANSGWQVCHAAEGCDQVPLNESGIPCETSARRWFCLAHRDQAAPGDLEPRGPGIRISESGALVPVEPDEEARAAAEAESRRRQHEDKAAAREHEAAEMRENERRREAAFESELPWNQACR